MTRRGKHQRYPSNKITTLYKPGFTKKGTLDQGVAGKRADNS